MRRARRRSGGLARAAGAIAVVVGAALALVAPGAVADEPVTLDDLGWWSRLNQDPTLAQVATATPDVTPGQLLVESTPEGATAIAALRATLPDGLGSPILTLVPASEAGGEAAILLACQAGSGWTGAHAGAWSAKPSPDCSASVQGIRAEDGASWTFPLAPLQFGDRIDVVLVAGSVEGSEATSPFRIVFERPGDDALVARPSSAGPTPIDLPPVAAPSEGPASPPPPPPGGSAPASPSFSVPAPVTDDVLAAQPVRAALPAAEQGATATAPVLTAQTPAPLPAAATSGTDGRLLGLLVVLCGLGLLAWARTQPVPEHRVLSRFGVAGAAAAAGTTQVVDLGAATGDGRVGGLGRFRRARDVPARRLGT